MTRRDELKAALAKAEAALVEAVLDSAKIGTHRAETNANLDKARAYCRQARAALVQLNRSESLVLSGEGFDTLIRHLGEVSDRKAAAAPPSVHSSELAVDGERETSGDESGRQKPIRRIDQAVAKSTLIRHAISLLALTLAYLQYYFIEVQLQIMSLPSITIFPIQ